MRISIFKNLTQKIKKFMTRKERFLFACTYNFYIQKAKIDLQGIGFLSFINEQHKKDWAKMKANELINLWKKEKTIDIRYNKALQWAKQINQQSA